MLALLALTALASAPVPEPPLQKVLDEAAAAGQPVFLDVYTSWCGPCRKLAADVLPAPDVRRALGAYRVQRYNAERGHGIDVARRYEVDRYPTLLVLNPDGVEIARIRQQTVEGLARALDEWRPLGAARFAKDARDGKDADPAALLVRGVVLEHQGRPGEALALYDLAEAMDPGDARGLASRAAFRKLRLELSKQFVRNRAGVLLEFAQKYPRTELAARAVAAVAQIAPAKRPAETRVREVSQSVVRGLQARKDPLALNAVTWSLLDMGFADLALEAARGAEAVAPYELDYVVAEAAALGAAGQWEQAKGLLEKGLRVDARHPALNWARDLVQRGIVVRREPATDLFTD
ncbi:MAG TPA: thioredoxin family protein [Myxococcaceae bacterium]